MTGRTEPRQARQPALDGMRAVAVSLVLAYHGGVPGFANAGFFGVDLFFVLSGYLITTLLLAEQITTGRINFAAFWARRARRLLPGLLLMLTAVVVYVQIFSASGAYPDIRADVLSVVAYVSNWHLIASSSNYFAASGTPSLLTHTWSLAIEEQFYLLWPLLLWGLRSWVRRAGRRPETVLAVVTGGGAVLSAGWMAYLYRSGGSFSRLYYGTDTHAQGLLVGATLAAVLAGGASRLDSVARPVVAVLAAVGVLVLSCRLGYSDGLTYEGGFLAVSLATAALLLVAVRQPGCGPSRILSVGPLAYLGRISYGMYLWYFPLFAVLDHSRTGLSGTPLFVVRVSVDISLAAASFHFAEQPIRTRLAGWPSRARSSLASLSAGGAALALTAGLVLVATPSAAAVNGPPTTASTKASTTAPSGGPRLLVIGDSTGTTLGIGLAQAQQTLGYSVDLRTILGCGLVVSADVIQDGSAVTPPDACRTGAPSAGQWTSLLKNELATDRPQAVLLVAGRWEVHTRRATPGGPMVDITQASDGDYVRAQMEKAVSLVAAAHVEIAIATAPCYSSGETPSGGAWPEDSPVRLEAYNSIVRQVAAENPTEVRIVDLNSWVCPGGAFHATVGGVTVRAPDGVHFPFYSLSSPRSDSPDTQATVRAFGGWIAPRIRGALTSG